MKKKISYIGQKIGGINLTTIEGRIIFQKSIYLLKELGAIKENFRFSFYIFGPYSSAVAKIGFDLIERNKDLEIETSDDFDTRLEKFKGIARQDDNQSKWLELLASLHHIMKNEKGNHNKEQIFERLKENKPYFADRNLFDKAWLSLRSNFIF